MRKSVLLFSVVVTCSLAGCVGDVPEAEEEVARTASALCDNAPEPDVTMALPPAGEKVSWGQGPYQPSEVLEVTGTLGKLVTVELRSSAPAGYSVPCTGRDIEVAVYGLVSRGCWEYIEAVHVIGTPVAGTSSCWQRIQLPPPAIGGTNVALRLVGLSSNTPFTFSAIHEAP